MKAKKKIVNTLCLLLCLFCAMPAFAQTSITVTGTVYDESDTPLPGASVAVLNHKKMARGTSTDIKGEFRIEINIDKGDSELAFSFVGTKTRKIKLTKDNINKPFVVRLYPDESMLEEVTIVEDGYSRLPRKDMVGAFTTVKADDVLMPAYQSIDQMLQGKIAGMSVVNSSARVGASPKITIRGTSTILGNSDPLWVVDGVIQEDPISIDMSSSITTDMRELIGNQISWLNPQDIDNITVLKDASATAIYGSKAS
ncbi:MAG: TonB-dependent receptor plug domain-containing protein, partial [Bacteroidaceae bacterium]|nr:TonB-dependent receptor plug domain-containing protein [Bacteroidaceae bacterium]